MKTTRSFLLGAASLLVCWLCLMFFILGVFIIDCSCFAADTSGNLYIGSRETVYVFSGDDLIRKMPMMGKACVFTIQEDDTILWGTGTNAYITDLEQNVIERWDDPGSEVFYRLEGNVGGNRVFVSKDGARYEKQSEFGGFRILKDSQVIYSSPISGRIMMVVMILSGMVGLIGIVMYCKEIADERKKNAKTMDR